MARPKSFWAKLAKAVVKGTVKGVKQSSKATKPSKGKWEYLRNKPPIEAPLWQPSIAWLQFDAGILGSVVGRRGPGQPIRLTARSRQPPQWTRVDKAVRFGRTIEVGCAQAALAGRIPMVAGQTQTPMSASSCGFKSHLRHHTT